MVIVQKKMKFFFRGLPPPPGGPPPRFLGSGKPPSGRFGRGPLAPEGGLRPPMKNQKLIFSVLFGVIKVWQKEV